MKRPRKYEYREGPAAAQVFEEAVKTLVKPRPKRPGESQDSPPPKKPRRR